MKRDGLMNNNNVFNNLDIIDAISIISFFAQLLNMKGDEIDKIKNNSILKAVADELEKLHNENKNTIKILQQVDQHEQKIIKQLDTIIYLLNGRL